MSATIRPALSACLKAGARLVLCLVAAWSTPCVLAAEPAAIAVPAAFNVADADRCLGYYQYADYRFYQFADFPVVARVYQQGSRWFVQDTGQAPIELVPARSDEVAVRFSTRVNQREYVFVMAFDGRARELVTIRQGQVVDQAPRVTQADWEASLTSLQQRRASSEPSRGTEAALRRQLQTWSAGREDFAPVPYRQVDARMEPETPERFRQTLAALGAFADLHFVGVDATGWDLFHLRFAQGTIEVAVAPLAPSGRFAGERFRPL